jgi:hypothetical protein
MAKLTKPKKEGWVKIDKKQNVFFERCCSINKVVASANLMSLLILRLGADPRKAQSNGRGGNIAHGTGKDASISAGYSDKEAGSMELELTTIRS